MLKTTESSFREIINGIFEKIKFLIMKKIALSFLVVSAIISCKETNSSSLFIEKETTTETSPSETTNPSDITASEAQNVELKVNPETNTTTTTQVQKFNVEAPKQAPQTGVTAPGFEGKPNPPHGQPGHRCDVKVGDPLPFNNVTSTTATPAKVATLQPTANTTPIVQQQPQQAATTGVTAPGFSGKPNPPHGQPGHRCDIKVGEILP